MMSSMMVYSYYSDFYDVFVDDSAFNGPIQNSLRNVLMQNNELKWNHFVQVLFNLHQLTELNVDFNKLSVRSSDLDESFVSNEHYFDVQLSLVSLSMQGNGLTLKSLEAFDFLYDYEGAHLPNSPYFRYKIFF